MSSEDLIPTDVENSETIASSGLEIKKYDISDFSGLKQGGLRKNKKIKLNKKNTDHFTELGGSKESPNIQKESSVHNNSNNATDRALLESDEFETCPTFGSLTSNDIPICSKEFKNRSSELKKISSEMMLSSSSSSDLGEYERFKTTLKKLKLHDESDISNYGLNKNDLEYDEMVGLELDVFCGFLGTMKDMRTVMYCLHRLETAISNSNTTSSANEKKMANLVFETVNDTCSRVSEHVMTIHQNFVKSNEQNQIHVAEVTNKMFEQYSKSNEDLKKTTSEQISFLHETIEELKINAKKSEENISKYLKTIADLKTENIVLNQKLTETNARLEEEKMAVASSQTTSLPSSDSDKRKIDRSSQYLLDVSQRKKQILNSLKY